MRTAHLVWLGMVTSILSVSTGWADEVVFQEQLLPTKLKVGYAVRLLDMNDDKRLDIVIVDSKRILWLENPTWKEHVLIETPDKTDNVCFAPHDIDGDGHLDFAVGADWTVNTKEGGSIQWITGGASKQGPWESRSIGTEPTVHRMQFADCNGDGRPELYVLPLLGRNTTRPHFQEAGVRLLAYEIPQDPRGGTWKPQVVSDEMHVTHNFWPTDLNEDGKLDLLVVSFEGVNLLQRQDDGSWKRTLIGTGDQKSSPNRGASEIKVGRFADGSPYIATIEPWHGNQVVVYTPPTDDKQTLWNRHVIDDKLKWGHAIWCADLDGDADEELVIGVRDNLDMEHQRGVRIFDPKDKSGAHWQRTLVDPDGVAVEDLAVGDLDGDGRADIVAVGRQTHNVKIYWNRQQ